MTSKYKYFCIKKELGPRNKKKYNNALDDSTTIFNFNRRYYIINSVSVNVCSPIVLTLYTASALLMVRRWTSIIITCYYILILSLFSIFFFLTNFYCDDKIHVQVDRPSRLGLRFIR